LRVDIRRTTVVTEPIDEVWSILRDFNGHALWHPAVSTSEIEAGEAADRVGAVRSFRLKDGSHIREQLLFLSDSRLSFGYCILEAPAPLHGYVAFVRLRPVTAENSCLWEWRSSFDSPPAERERLARFVRDDIIKAGFAGLREFMRAERAGSVRTQAVPPSTARGGAAGVVEVVLTRYGGPEVLKPRSAQIREPAAREARIRQTAIGVNFIDVYCRRGSFDLVPPGGVIGMEAAGVVESIGPNVASVRPGDRVAYACAPPGAYASMRIMQADLLVRLPESLSELDAAGLLFKGITASFLLHDVAHARPGSIVLVHAAAGGVGQILCRWAKAIGAFVIGATSSETKAEAARRTGCDAVVIAGREDLTTAVRRLTSGRGVDIVYDAVGKDTFGQSVACLAPRGHLVSFGQASGDVGTHSIDRLANQSATISRPNYAHYTDAPDKIRAQSERLFEALKNGAVVAAKPRTFSLDEAALAHSELENRRTIGSLVLIP
jgi:NADPH:quinone reductase-like Zn-dependent oxidoreductase